MKLVRITHRRCGDYSASTVCMAPDDWDEDTIEREALEAHEEYLMLYARAAKPEDGPPYPGHMPDYKAEANQGRTVGDVHREWQEKHDAWQAWSSAQNETHKRFEVMLYARGFVALWSDQVDAEPVILDWGHRHGQRLRYGNEDEVESMPPPAKLAAKDAGEEYEDPHAF